MKQSTENVEQTNNLYFKQVLTQIKQMHYFSVLLPAFGVNYSMI